MTSLLTRARGSVGRVVASALVMVAAAGLVFSACGGSGYRYVKSTSNGAYFKIPEDWKLFSTEQILKDIKLSEAERERIRFLAVFDGDPSPSLSHTFTESLYPSGIVRVRQLTGEERDAFSLAALRNELFGIDSIADKTPDALTLLADSRRITKADGTRGSRLVYKVTQNGVSFSVDQTTLVDAATEKVYAFGIGCETSCYEQNRRLITEIADSWTVKEP